MRHVLKVNSLRKPSCLLLLAVMALSTAGCQSLDDLERANFHRACDNMGIQRGSPSYDECMLQQQRLEVEQTEGFLNRTAVRERRKH